MTTQSGLVMRLLDLRVINQSRLSSASLPLSSISSVTLPNSTSAYSSRAMWIHIVRRTSTPQGEHAFLGHPWWQNGSDRGIAWGVLESPGIKNLLGLIKAHRTEEAILCPRYLIGATREGSNALSLDPTAPLSL